MPIRSLPALPSFLAARAWPGIRPWLWSVLGNALVFSALAAFAWRGATHRLPDISTFLITIPIGMVLLVAVLALIWYVIADIPLTSSLTFVARILPLAWLFPLIDIVRSLGQGFVLTHPPFDVAGLFQASFTASLLPIALPVPIGIRAGIVAGTVIAAFVVWFTRRSLSRAIVSGLLASAAFVKIALFPGVLSVIPSLAVANGYWWLNIYERFPTAVDAQALSALQLATNGFFILLLGAVAFAFLFLALPAARKLLKHGFQSWSFLHAVIFVIAGGFIAAFSTPSPSFLQGNGLSAFLLAVLLFVALRLHFVMERCLHRAGTDKAMSICQPITDGHITPAHARELSFFSGGYALLAAWALGWPVFSAILAALAASTLSRHPLWMDWPIAATVFRAAGAASLALAGFFFVSQNARLIAPAIAVALVAAAYQAGAEFFAKRRA